jgi:signal transduction histidine kinase
VSGDDGLLTSVLKSRQAWIPDEGEGSPALDALLGRPPRLVVPLVASARVVALLAAGADQRLTAGRLEPLLPEASTAIRNARLYRDAVLGLAEARGARAAPPPAPAPARDLSNLLGVVLGRLASLRDRVADPDGQRDVEVAEEAAWRAAESMRGLLGFAPGRRGTPLAPLDLGAVVHEAVGATSRRRTAGGRPPPRIQADLDVMPPVRGSAEDLREMLGHLLDNALEAGPPDAPVLVRARWDGGAHVDLDVVDAGTGMDDATRSRTFEPFFSTKGEGHLGLGLPVAQAIVARHHGELTLRSEPGHGTTVEVRLPTVASVRRPAGASTPVARVLLVEDEPQVREALLDALSQQGHVVHVAADGRAALAILEREPVDVVVTDLALPGVSGLEVARVAKQLRPGTPVILVTAWPAGPDASRLEASGVDAVIDKPVGLSEFRATVALVLARRGGPTA